MKTLFSNTLFFTFVFLCSLANCQQKKPGDMIKLPPPRTTSNVSVEEALLKRRSIRHYKQENLTLAEISQVLWAAYGTTAGRRKTCPSAGATYPLEIYLVAGEIDDLPTGFYKYNSKEHALVLLSTRDYRQELTEASLYQDYILKAPASIVIAADYQRTTSVYGSRGERYVHMEVGHCGQNIHLQCEALQLGTVVIGAFEDNKIKSILQIHEEPLYIMPIGRKPN